MRACSPQILIIEGEIAAGKTELVRALAHDLRAQGVNAHAVFEPVEKWKEVGILKHFYADPTRWGYAAQTFIYATRVAAIAEAVSKNPDAEIFVLERSPATDVVFMELQRSALTPIEMRMYAEWCGAYCKMLPIDLSTARVLRLQTSLQECMRRLEKRGREGEITKNEGEITKNETSTAGSARGGVSIAYQARLRDAQNEFFSGVRSDKFALMPPSPFAPGAVRTVSFELADLDFVTPGPVRDTVIREILAISGLKLDSAADTVWSV